MAASTSQKEVEQRLNLQRQFDELRRSIKYWRSWEAEYEGFKEEIEALGDDVSPGKMVSTLYDKLQEHYTNVSSKLWPRILVVTS